MMHNNHSFCNCTIKKCTSETAVGNISFLFDPLLYNTHVLRKRERMILEYIRSFGQETNKQTNIPAYISLTCQGEMRWNREKKEPVRISIYINRDDPFFLEPSSVGGADRFVLPYSLTLTTTELIVWYSKHGMTGDGIASRMSFPSLLRTSDSSDYCSEGQCPCPCLCRSLSFSLFRQSCEGTIETERRGYSTVQYSTV